MSESDALMDRFGRRVDYVRISLTDRCDFRCRYCMAEEMTFTPRQQLLTYEEVVRVARAFVALGVKRLRITGGEPLVRADAVDVITQLGQLSGLEELNLTTNGSQLESKAAALKAAGVNRINISLDTLNAIQFQHLTRTGKLQTVLAGIDAACAAGFERIRLNAVILRGYNEDQIVPLVEFATERQLDIAFIEEMPLGDIGRRDRAQTYMASAAIREQLARHYALVEAPDQSAGPARYYQLAVSGPAASNTLVKSTRIGFISPHSHNFCSQCNRVRLTAEGRLLLCLGNEHSVDLRALLRGGVTDAELRTALTEAMALKPERHEFDLAAAPSIVRFMNTTGG